ncbi:hypothetical protein CALCODRAFT_513638, partial [Calocera cornea HHB12733]
MIRVPHLSHHGGITERPVPFATLQQFAYTPGSPDMYFTVVKGKAATVEVHYMCQHWSANSGFAELSSAYVNPHFIICPPVRLAMPQQRQRVVCAVFEAIVGATALQHGVPAIWQELVGRLRAWLQELGERAPISQLRHPPISVGHLQPQQLVIEDGETHWRSVPTKQNSALAEFRLSAKQMRLTVNFREACIADSWLIYLSLEGDEVAAAVGPSKQAAKQAAAHAALPTVNWALAISRAYHRVSPISDTDSGSTLSEAPNGRGTIDTAWRQWGFSRGEISRIMNPIVPDNAFSRAS